MALTLTPAAAQHIKSQLDNRGKGLGIRLGVKTSGCSGMAYLLEFVDDPAAEDVKFEDHDVAIFVDPKSLVYLDGTQLIPVQEGLNSGLQFKNPNVTGECGCGESFAV